MTQKQIEELIHIVEPTEPFVSPQPTVRWTYEGDLHPVTVDVVFVDLKTFEHIWFLGIDAKKREFTPREPLPSGNYEIRLRSGRPIQFVARKRRVGIVAADYIAEKKRRYSETCQNHLRPRTLGPSGSVHLRELAFFWECLGGDIQSFIVQLFQDDSGKLIRSWKGIPPSQFSLEVGPEELQDLSSGHYYWLVRAVYFERDLLSEPLYFELREYDGEVGRKESQGHLAGEFEQESCSEVPGKTSDSPLISALPVQQEESSEIIRVSDVGIKFKKTTSGTQKKIGRSLTSIFKMGTKVENFWALKAISFSVQEGEVLGVVGKNGAGKSTLLRMLTGVLSPDEGTIQIDGKVSALLALGAGFMSDLSGRENIYLNGIYMGLSKKDLAEIYDQIVDFAELGDFIDTQVRYYSSGMKARLGFSVAVHVDPEILIIDEVLGAGDKDFRKKAEKKMREFLEKAKAIVIASHSMKLITDLCTKCIWLENGAMKAFGLASEVVKEYLES